MNVPYIRRSRGFSLVEILLVLGLLAVFLAAVFVTYPQVRGRNYVNIEQQRLLRTLAVVKNLYATKQTYDNLTTDVANQAKAFMPEANAGNYGPGQTIINVWGGEIEVSQHATNPAWLEIRYAGIPADACVQLATGVTVNNFKALAIDGTVVWQASDVGEMDVSGIVEACNASDDGAMMGFASD